MSSVIDSPPRAPPVKYRTPLGTRWEKEKAAAGQGAFDYPDDAKFVGPWIIGECVGKGASGHVKIARHRRTGQLAAVKILPLQPFVSNRNAQAQAKTEKQRMGIDREITMMKLMNHPNIMRIYDVYEGEKELYLILEYVEGGELFDFLVNRGKLAPLEALGYFKQIVYGINYAHTFSIIHRDLKPENILIHSLDPPLVKIADWGMAAFAPPTLQLETSCGSPHYASPEIVNGHRYTGTATDIWSCGVILYALLTGRLPFDDKNVRTLLGKVKLGKYEMPTYIDPLAKDLLSRMLVVDCKKRISMTEVLEHPWLQSTTPGITYVPAPPVSELARPLPSARHIDRDLFHSLCVIWGRHADYEQIKADLLSPAGEGVLAKAFYFLLQKHRERTMEEHGILMDDILKSPGKVVIKQYATPKYRKGESEIIQSTKPPRPTISTLSEPAASACRSPSPVRPLQMPGLPAIAMERTASRDHPPSPVGPRPQRPRPTSSPVGEDIIGSPPARGYASDARSRLSTAGSPTPVRKLQLSEMLAGLPHDSRSPRYPGYTGTSRPVSVLPPVTAGQPARGTSSMTPGFVHAPTPVPALEPKILPMITAPRVGDAELQRTIDQYANMVNERVQTWNTAQSQRVTEQSATSDTGAHPHDGHVRSRSSRPAEVPLRHEELRGNKENVDDVDAGAKTAQGTVPGGLGFGSSVPMPNAPLGKEMANLLVLAGPEKRDKKHRASTIDIGSPSLQKRGTFTSMLGSPVPMSPPPSTLLGSPAVGEFKGWFSNLFHWKAQSYLLYSTDDVVTSRNEVRQLLQSLGISVLEDFQWGILKCRADDVYEHGSLVQKATRFRVEVHNAATYVHGAGPATPRLAHHPVAHNAMSPQMSAPRSRTQLERPHGYDTVIALALEKGSVTTFKAVYQRVKADWRLDALQSPRTSVVGGNVTPSIDQRLMA
ncbi:serine/threonine-protein kinase [Phanerochaete sordida]|uniref:Serine/threonine-protein kinase n=1 Tax=Phanerochaete sordida TaxID=48140 RepID=A0A9P3FZ80_9APHY|nr:serine/threonine-protein kinase [Phanerochaete sordida]